MTLAQALALHRAGRRREARPLYERALDQHPGDAQARFAYGLCLLEEGALAEGVAAMRRLLQAAPDHAGAHQALGKALAMGGDAASAETHLRRAVALAPDASDAWIELGALLAPRAPAEAEAVLRQALDRHPRHAGLWCNLGNLLGRRGRRAQAAECWRKALAFNPAQVEAELALALERRADGQVGEAAAMLERAIARRPDIAELHYNLGVTYHHARKPAEAAAALKRALAANPRFHKASVQLAQVAQSVCDWDALDRLMPVLRAETARAVAGKPCLVSPFFSLSLPLGEAERLAIARAKAREVEIGVAPDRGAIRPPAGPPAREAGPLRIGYLCSDFRDHPTAHLMAGLFELHDRARVRVAAYSYGPDDASEYRRRVERGVDAFVDLAALDHVAAARRIRDDGTDILVDVNGYITHSRPEIAAMRPAPVQATYLAFPGTTGAAFFDYALVDATVTPASSAQHYAERLVLLPHSYQVNDRGQPIGEPATRAAEGLPEGGFVFCCFCASFKIEPAVFAVWMRLLAQVEGSVLWLYSESALAETNLRAHARALGVDEARLVFARRRPKPAHLARLRLADLVLDTLTYGAHTTASDALWAGVPVVTRPGDAFAGRVGASLLQAVGLPELVAPDLAAYEALALRLARDGGALADLRRKLAGNRLARPLFDTPRFARGLEEAFARMWARHRAGERPALIDLTGWAG